MNTDNQLLLRAAHRSEARYIAELSRVQIEYGLAWRWTPARVRRNILDPETMALIASNDGNLCGFAIMRFGEVDAHLLLLAVESKRRREGIGLALLAWLEKSVRTAGLQRIRVEVRESNNTALQFYRSLGYRFVHKIDCYYDGRESALILAKQLCATDCAQS